MFVESMLQQEKPAQRMAAHISSDPDTLHKQLAQLQEQLAALRAQYTENHPDVRRVKKDVAELEKRIHDSATVQEIPAENTIVEEPIETAQSKQLKAQLYQINLTIKNKTAEQAKIQQEIGNVQAKLKLTPAIGQEYKALTRDYQTAANVYNELLRKQTDSEMASDLEKRQQGEQFRVLDPPSLPQKPTYPNRPVFGVGGFMSGLALGLAIVFVLEAQDTTFRNERDVERVLKLPALAMIPLLQVTKENSTNQSHKASEASQTAMSGMAS
jgi:uncharacterized protein involved in exopolysaccharide biosynthesis